MGFNGTYKNWLNHHCLSLLGFNGIYELLTIHLIFNISLWFRIRKKKYWNKDEHQNSWSITPWDGDPKWLFSVATLVRIRSIYIHTYIHYVGRIEWSEQNRNRYRKRIVIEQTDREVLWGGPVISCPKPAQARFLWTRTPPISTDGPTGDIMKGSRGTMGYSGTCNQHSYSIFRYIWKSNKSPKKAKH